MKLREIYRFEVAHQTRRPWFWLIAAVIVLLSFLMTRDGALSVALYDDFQINAPFAIAKTTVFGGLLWLLGAAAIAGEAAARDIATRIHPLLYTSPINRSDYVGGRFLAALTLNACLLLAVQAGILLGVYLPGVDAAAIGPMRPAAYLTAYLFLAIPNALFGTAMQFAFALRARRAMAAYAGSLTLFFMGFFVASVALYRQSLGSFLDPIGVRYVMEDLSYSWTPIERNTRLIELSGTVLWNRLVWVTVGLTVLGWALAHFRFAHVLDQPNRWPANPFRRNRTSHITSRAADVADNAVETAGQSLAHYSVTNRSLPGQFCTVALISAKSVILSWVGVFFLAVLPLLAIPVIIDQMVSAGVPLIPSTARVLSELTAPLSAELSRWVVVPMIIVYFGGELVWRERDASISDISDSLPVSDWVPLLGKFTGLLIAIALFLILQAAAGIVAQTLLGYHHYEPALYLGVLLGLQFPEYALFALLAIVVHVVVNQKYAGHLVAVLCYVFISLSSLFGIEHNLLVYGAGPSWSHSEMRGFAPSLAPWAWFKLYWLAWAVLLAVVARLLWQRGRETSVRTRLASARQRFRGATTLTTIVATAGIVGVGGFVFYNTNVLNPYITTAEGRRRSAEYERTFGAFANVAQPVLSHATLAIDVHPRERRAGMRGTYRLVNRSGTPIDSIHVATASGVSTDSVRLSRPFREVVRNESLHHRILALDSALQPGDSVELSFAVSFAPRGFREGGADPSVVENGSAFSNAWLPAIGYQASRELIDAADRRPFGLPVRAIIPRLDGFTPGTNDGGVVLETTISTSDDETAVAPGSLLRSWKENGRSFFTYSTGAPIGGEWAFFSSRYALRESRWAAAQGTGDSIVIRLYHHPDHTRNLDRMLASIRASLDYYTKEFGPYRLPGLTVVERPGEGAGIHADPGMLVFTEGTNLWTAPTDSTSIDLPYAVAAHEMGHQWTVPYASVEGAPVMSESVAWYYGMKLVQHAWGDSQLRSLIAFMRQPNPYPPIKRGEPLMRGLDPYLSYRRGPFALYAVSEYAGAERMHRALRQMLEAHRAPGAPLATTRDLLAALKSAAPDSVQSLVHDLFEVNTTWDVRVDSASARQTAAGWEVTVTVATKKTVFDSAGVVTTVPINDLVEIAVDDQVSAADATPMYRQFHRLTRERQSVTVLVSRKPVRVGADPRGLLLDYDLANNVREIPN
ncbi:MAG: hypothetical protein ACO1Q7_16875 [Gemmatimonas sp.]